MKKKKFYEQPQSAVTQVELESPICSGSVDITAQSPTEVTRTEAQVVNKDFATDNDFSSTNTWN